MKNDFAKNINLLTAANAARLTKILTLSASICALTLCACVKKPTPVKSDAIADEVFVSRPLVLDTEIVNSYSARIAPSEDVEIRARVGGYLEKVFFKKGANVNKNDILFKIDDRPYAAALAAAEAKVDAAKSKIELTENNAKRARKLFEKNAISKEAYQTRETELLLAKSALLEAQAAEKNARLNMEFTNVAAPISGVVSENFADEGNLIAPNSTKLARIVNNSTAKVYFELNSADAMRYKNLGLLKSIDKGDGANVEVIMKNDSKIYRGKLCYYDNTLGKGTSSLIVRADIDNADGGLMAGAFGDIKVMESIAKNSILVPENSIGTDLTGMYLLTLNPDNTVKETPVSLGVKIGSLRVIESGLNKDSQVIIKGIQRASVGRKVKPIEAKIDAPSNK